jgi:N-acetylneuraminic acid mutarotase
MADANVTRGRFVACLLSLFLTACGGGGGDPPAQPQAPQATSAPEPAKVEPPSAWKKYEGAPWTWRDGAGLLAKDGGLYMLGGWGAAGTNSEVWFTRDLSTWERLADAPWPARHGAAWLVHKDRLYVIGGDFNADVWSSADGVNWSQHAVDAPFGKRYAPNAVSLNGELLVFNGMLEDITGAAEVWSSTDDGATWVKAADVPYPARGLIHGTAVFRDRIYTIAGGLKDTDTLMETADVWSSADGRTWRKEADSAGFEARSHHAVLATAEGCYVANGSVGRQLNTVRDVFFAPDCVTFTLLSQQPDREQAHAASLVEFGGSVVLLGGHGDHVGSGVWQYTP